MNLKVLINYFVDTQPPTIDHCPSTLMFYLKDNEESTYIHWVIPTVSDNKDDNVMAKQISGPVRSTKQEVNTYAISYEAIDAAGNKAKKCSFVVVVKRKRHLIFFMHEKHQAIPFVFKKIHSGLRISTKKTLPKVSASTCIICLNTII